MPGFGRSYPSDGNPLLTAPAAVLDFLDGLELDSVPIVGNSAGGGVAARLAADSPDRVRRLVMVGGLGLGLFSPAPTEGIKLLVQFVEDPTKERLISWMESMVFDTSILTEDFVAMRWEAAQDPAALTDLRKLFNAQMLSASRQQLGAVERITMLPKIQAPTLITFGRDDRVTPIDGMLVPMRYIRKCEIHVFHDCGHWAMIERKDEFESVVMSFLVRDL
jgi:pimeloyl-ACP methyl ester carboxylesterase